MSADPRSWRIAVVADSLLEERLPELGEAGFGVMQLPPAALDPETSAAWLELLAEQVAEYCRNGYEVVVLDDGAHAAALSAALGAIGVEPLPHLAPAKDVARRPSNRRRRAG